MQSFYFKIAIISYTSLQFIQMSRIDIYEMAEIISQRIDENNTHDD